jgi:glucuronoarabinoxylan endo-1,4-beta-xylanase
MDGFGGGITWGNNVLHANSSKAAIYDLLFTDLGLDIVRIRNVYGRSDNSTTDHDRQTYVAAKARNSEIKFLISSWSPPADLKDNGSVLGNGDNPYATLVYQNGSFVYNEFASYWNSSLNSYASLGLTLDYVSIQNEPDYDATWESCCLRPVEEVYNGKLFPGYNTCLDRVYAQLPTSIKFVGPEATGVVNNRVQDFVDVLDTSKLSVVAHHLYNGGDTANPDTYNANLQSMSAKYPGKTVWQTEFDQCSPFKTAWLMHNCIVEGRASAYIHWKAIWSAPDDRSFIAVNSGSGYSINKYFYYFKQFSKYISAGHKRVAASSNSSDVKMSAYLNPSNTQLTVVLINKGAASQTMALNIGGYPITGSAVYRTSSSENFVSVGALGSGNTVTLPAQSVSTAVLTIAIDSYTIDASAAAGGSIAPSGQRTVSEGGSQTYTITPATGYAVAGVLVDGASVGAVASYTFTNVNANHTISATFTAASSYSITASAGTGGSISPSGMVTVLPGSSQTFTITPSTGYEIASVLVDGSSAGTPATYTFSSVSASHTISATFSSLTKYQINCGGSASAPYTADQYYSGGTARTVTNTITTTGVTNPAPQAVYKAERYGTSTYTLPNLLAGAQYTVRLHFAELYQTASGKRKFNVLINGTTVLSNYDIYAAAGARYKAVVREFTAIANTSGQIVINFTTVTDNATVEGIEIIKLITNTAPTITTAASATPNPITATTTVLSVLGADDNGEPNLTYTWTAAGTPPAAVTFSANGTNAAKATTATFAKAGSYTFQVTATDAGGLTATSSVGVTVNQTMTDIVITPGSATISPSEAQQFTDVARDQFASSLTTQPDFTWDVSGGGTIDGIGLFTAGTSSGTFTVTATSGSVSATAVITINAAPTIATVASATPNPVVATAASLSALGADDFGESNLTYTWATVGTVPAAVMFSVNGTNAAKTSTVYFSSAGSYTFQVTVSDQPGLTATSMVDVIVDQTVTSISVSPTNATVNVSATQQFTAVARDQFVNDLTTPPAFIWSVNGGGTIDGSGLFTAGTAAGDFTVIATSGSVSRTEGVTVVVPNTAPVIATEASAAPNPVTAATTLLSVLGADDNGESNLTYTWATAGTPPATVTFSANGTNAAKAVTATFTKAGSYTFQVTVRDQGNLTVTSMVSLTVNQTLTSITLSPASASMAISATQQFTATGFDQFAIILSTQPAFTWSVSGVGTITASGLYSAGTSSGTATITVASGSVSRTASVTVAPSTVYQINCGGSASSPYTADQYYSGGTVYSVTSTIITTGVTNPAPQSVYKTERYGAMTYTLPNLTAGVSYRVRLHLAELYHSASGKRRFNVAINGTTVLSNYDIYAETGARYKAVVKEYTTIANASGQIVIKFTNVTDNAKIGGIEIIRQ